MVSRILILFVLLVLPVTVSVAGERGLLSIGVPSEEASIKMMERDTVSIITKAGEKYYFDTEFAVTGAQQARGMMYRNEMGRNEAMLFLFSNEKKRSFWMKNTFIPLDMIFIAKDGEILHIHQNAKPQDLSMITSKYPSVAVLEVKGGTSYRLGIENGDVVVHDAFMSAQAQ